MMTFMDENPQLIYKFTHEKEKFNMPYGTGSYGSKKGRPPKKKKAPRAKKVQGKLSGSRPAPRYSKKQQKPVARRPK